MTIAKLLDGRGAVFTCEARESVGAVTRTLAGHRIGAMPVLADGGVVGIVSERDILYRLGEEGAGVLDRTVGEIMTAPPVTVSPDTDVLAALALMTRRRIRHLPVIEDGAMIGFVSIGDLVKYRIDRIESEAEAMRSYIQTA